MLFYRFFFLFFFSSLASCFLLKPVILKKPFQIGLEFKNEQVFQKQKVFKKLKVGGLSELVFDKSSGYFLALSDDKKDHRWYQMALISQPHYKMEIKGQVFLKSLGHKKLRINMDPEALAIYGKNQILIASEGQQIYEPYEPTQLFTFDRQGFLKEAWPVPSVFWDFNQNKASLSFGQQENKGFESLALDKASGRVWTATEQPLKQDLIFKLAFVRLSVFDSASKEMKAQYLYPLRDKNGGLTALQLIKPKLFISVERVYKKQKTSGINEVYLFLTDCRQARPLPATLQLKTKWKACAKKQLWSSTQQTKVKVDNIEGLTIGPDLGSNKQLLVLVSDNNFNEEKQKTQFLFFELHLREPL